MTKLTETQSKILKAAAERSDSNIEPLPSHINAGIRPRVIQGLLNRQLIEQTGDMYIISQTGFLAIGAEKPKKKPQQRDGTKQARMIALMQRAEGASIDEICSETDWQKHTVRGVFSNTLKKRLGLTVTSYKDEGQPRRYRVSGGE
jgi:hypothetical protein